VTLNKPFRLALPDDDHIKAELPQCVFFSSISRTVIRDLASPKGIVSLRNRRFLTTFMAVPKAAMHKYTPPFRPVR
jgi:hypothetical protein